MNATSAEGILADIRRGVAEDDPLYRDFLQLALRYARARTDWRMSAPDERHRQDEARSRTHNALIDAVNTLSRQMARSGADNRWRERMGSDRREIGDFACHLHCLLGIEAR